MRCCEEEGRGEDVEAFARGLMDGLEGLDWDGGCGEGGDMEGIIKGTEERRSDMLR